MQNVRNLLLAGASKCLEQRRRVSVSPFSFTFKTPETQFSSREEEINATKIRLQ